MATIYSNKNQYLPYTNSATQLSSINKSQKKLYVASNIFASQYQIKNVHVIDGSSILYETFKDNKRQIIHEVVLWKQDFKPQKILQKISILCQLFYIEKVFFEDADFEYENTNFQHLGQLLEKNEQIKIRIVIQDSFCQQSQKNQKSPDLINTLNQFLQFIKIYNQLKLKYPWLSQNALALRNQSTNQSIIYPLDFFVEERGYSQSLETIIILYLISTTTKNIKDFFNVGCKKTDFLLKAYQNKFSYPQFKEFTELMKDVLQNKQKYTQKMFLCYLEILKQKNLKSIEQNAMSKFIQNKKSSYQPPQRDNYPSQNFSQQRQKQSNSFSNLNEAKPKSLSRKLKLQKQQIQTGENFRHSEVRKSSSIISMSPNRKNRKYLKYTSSSLFSNSKQTMQRSSSSSFLMKSTQGFYQNTGGSFYNKNVSNQVQNSRSQNNFFKKPDHQNLPIKAESQIKNYLQTMGFGNKNLQRGYQKDQKKISHTLHYQNHKNEDNLRQSYQISAQQISYKDNFNDVPLDLNLNEDQKKLRLKQSLSLLQKKRNSQNFNNQSIIPEKIISQNQGKVQNEIQIRQNYSTQQIFLKKQNNLVQNISQKSTNKFINFSINHQNCMDINIKGTKKKTNLKIQRSTVMVMHFFSNERRQTQHIKQSLSWPGKDKLIQQSINESTQVKKQKQLAFKPSLASLKKQKVGEKSDRHQKISPNSVEEKLSIPMEQKIEGKRNQTEKQKATNRNLPADQPKKSIKSEKQALSSISETTEIQTQQLSKNSLQSTQSKQKQLTLSKQFLKQIFLFINSQNKAFVDLLGSKLSYQITFYAFYINYFKLNVTKTTTKQAIQKMALQINDYENKIMDSQKFNSVEKIQPQFQPFVKKLINLKLSIFMDKYSQKQELSPNEKEKISKMSQEIDQLTVGILKVTLKIIINSLKSFKYSNNQVSFILRSLKICSTIRQLIYCISNKLLSMTITELKKITQTALANQFGYEKSLIENLSKSQAVIQTYNDHIRQYQNGKQVVIDIKSETKKIQTFIAEI